MLCTPDLFSPLLQMFAEAFTRPTFAHAKVLLFGAILAPGRRTVASALRAMGLREERRFTTYHRVLNRAVWSSQRLSRILLNVLVTTLLPREAPLIILVDGTLERRWGRKIAIKGRFYDAVRSTSGQIVTTEGIHWLCFLLLVRLPWCSRPWALPFLTVSTLTPATSVQLGKRHRTVPEYVRPLIRVIRWWQPDREIILVGDSSFAVAALGNTCRIYGVRLVSRLLLNAQLYDPVPPQPKGNPGVKPAKGPRQPNLADRLTDQAANWEQRPIGWYAGQPLLMDLRSRGRVMASGWRSPTAAAVGAAP